VKFKIKVAQQKGKTLLAAKKSTKVTEDDDEYADEPDELIAPSPSKKSKIVEIFPASQENHELVEFPEQLAGQTQPTVLSSCVLHDITCLHPSKMSVPLQWSVPYAPRSADGKYQYILFVRNYFCTTDGSGKPEYASLHYRYEADTIKHTLKVTMVNPPFKAKVSPAVKGTTSPDESPPDFAAVDIVWDQANKERAASWEVKLDADVVVGPGQFRVLGWNPCFHGVRFPVFAQESPTGPTSFS
jgi:hypothetical protein